MGQDEGGGGVLRRWTAAALIGFTYIGTVVGAGFATGQEILQFFTVYGKTATLTIVVSSALFIWLGTKLMLIARRIRARSYEDMNVHIFGETIGSFVSWIMMLLLLAISSVMLAGAGAVFREHLNMNYQTGLIVTAVLAYVVMRRGMNGIKTVNSFVVPIMLVFTAIVCALSLRLPASGNFVTLHGDYPLWRVWLSPFMYTAFNLALAQAVLVPLGASTQDERTIRLGGLIGGGGIAIMLLAGHISLSAHMPGITQFDIPMGQLVAPLGPWVQLMFLFLIYAEIYTTLIANVYGLALQIKQHSRWGMPLIYFVLLLFCYTVSQLGFKTLLSALYPALGLISLVWLAMLLRASRSRLRL